MMSITDFPTELLLKIFLENSLLDLQFPHNPRTTTLNSSQVCHQWRHILLDLPVAWAQSLDMDTNLGLQNMILERCRHRRFDALILPSISDKLPLTHQLRDKFSHNGTIPIAHLFESHPFHYHKFYEKMSLLFSQLHRTRRVALKIPAHAWMHLWLALVQYEQAVKNLDSLILVADHRSVADQVSFSTCQRLDPYLLYGMQARPHKNQRDHWNLRSLELRGCTFTLDSPAFGNLEELSLHNLSSIVAYSPHNLARSVATMSRLKRLEVVNATLTTEFWRHGEDLRFDYNAPSFDLPNLESLSVRGPTSHCAQLFCRLDLQPACSIELVCEEGMHTSLGSSEPIAFHGLTNRLEAIYGSNSASLGDSLFIKVFHNSVVMRNFPFFLQEQRKNIYPSVEISFFWGDDARSLDPLRPSGPPFVLADFMRGLCKSFAGITSLHLNFQAPIPIDPYQHFDLVRKFSYPFVAKLLHLNLYNHNTVEFLSPYFTHTPCNRQRIPPLEFLKLNALFFYNMDFGGILRPCGKRTLDVLQAYVDDRHRAQIRTIRPLEVGEVEGMTEDAVRQFRDAGGCIVINSGSICLEAHSSDAT